MTNYVVIADNTRSSYLRLALLPECSGRNGRILCLHAVVNSHYENCCYTSINISSTCRVTISQWWGISTYYWLELSTSGLRSWLLNVHTIHPMNYVHWMKKIPWIMYIGWRASHELRSLDAEHLNYAHWLKKIRWIMYIGRRKSYELYTLDGEQPMNYVHWMKNIPWIMYIGWRTSHELCTLGVKHPLNYVHWMKTILWIMYHGWGTLHKLYILYEEHPTDYIYWMKSIPWIVYVGWRTPHELCTLDWWYPMNYVNWMKNINELRTLDEKHPWIMYIGWRTRVCGSNQSINILRLRINGGPFAENISECIFLIESVCILLIFLPKIPVNSW